MNTEDYKLLAPDFVSCLPIYALAVSLLISSRVTLEQTTVAIKGKQLCLYSAQDHAAVNLLL